MAKKKRPQRRGSEYVYNALVNAGVDILVGLPGTQTLPLDRTVAQRNDIDYMMARHETAIPHIAWGYYEAGGGLAATLTVPGPGDTNSAHGLKNSYDDCVPLLHISPVADPADFGKHPIHELEHETFDHVVKANLQVRNPRRLREKVARAISVARETPTGPVRLAVPSTFLTRKIEAAPVSATPESTDYDIEEDIIRGVDILSDAQRPLIIIGGGARRSPNGSKTIASLVDVLSAPVAVTMKGKGVLPENDPNYLGATGKNMPVGARHTLEASDAVLALGTDFDGPNTDNWSLPIGDSLVHVTVDPDEIDNTYDADIGIIGDVGTICERLTGRLRDRDLEASWDGQQLATDVREEYVNSLRSRGLLADGPPVTTPAVLRTVRETIPDEAIATTDIGGHRVWSRNAFAAYGRDQFITAGSWAGMGVGLPSAIGAKLACPDRSVVCLTGDGSLMMCAQELHTAAARNLDLVVVLFNDADYGIISKSPKIDDRGGDHRFSWSSPDWISIAEGFGCQGRRAQTRNEVRDAVDWALMTDGPTLVDVEIDPDELTPYEAAEYETEIAPTDY